ncbi:MAG: mannose-6-phosphate isomerase, class I [Chitinophagaceae bacterium]
MNKETLIFPLCGQIQHYSWGGCDFIPQLLGIKNLGHRPFAEYWMGTHHQAPSDVILPDGKKIPLPKLIEKAPSFYLGARTFEHFKQLPYLFKILDVRNMLSIQVHPSKSEAEKGFALENAAGIKLDAPERNYKDPNHKPEVMVALGNFWLLHGFLPEMKMIQRLQKTPEFLSLLPVFQKEGYQGLYQKVMELPQHIVDQWLAPLAQRILPLYHNQQLKKEDPAFWAAKAILGSPTNHLDRGIFSIYFFNILEVNAGEGVFQGAGLPHAYLEGQNMELMANSDNVLRGGLTPKFMDVPELLKKIKFEPTLPQIIKGNLSLDGMERIYPCPVSDFRISRLEITSKKEFKCQSSAPEIIISIQGSAHLRGQTGEVPLKQGGAAIIFCGEDYQLTTQEHAILFKATVPD